MKSRAVSVPVTPIIGPLKPATSPQHKGMALEVENKGMECDGGSDCKHTSRLSLKGFTALCMLIALTYFSDGLHGSGSAHVGHDVIALSRGEKRYD